ncbi:MAG: hypothetical protein KAR20_29065, partial [Candidatus Heimdallarchaeota archaeon]|nr:hypothetical protein [Candidatus Heimdallarchaeota archaeon]
MKNGFAILTIIFLMTFWLFGMNDYYRSSSNDGQIKVSQRNSQKSSNDIVEIVDKEDELKQKTSAAVQKALRFLAD